MTEDPDGIAGAFQEGADSFLHGIRRADCPYPPDTADREAWLKGWDRAATEPA